jgi:hypothetical protein
LDYASPLSNLHQPDYTHAVAILFKERGDECSSDQETELDEAADVFPTALGVATEMF